MQTVDPVLPVRGGPGHGRKRGRERGGHARQRHIRRRL